ncbi:MAG: transcriptional repressor [Phycisphaerales bacterium]|nr:transcriptional repressor [Phycisphaerales bacterium]
MNLPPASSPEEHELQITEPLCAVFRRKLKSVGQKYTPERARILDAVIRWEETTGGGAGGGGVGGGGGVFQADQLLESMRRSGEDVSKATIYRTIKLLADAGIIQQVLFDGESAHYQLAYGQAGAGLVVDVDTGAVRSVPVPELAAIRDRICAALGMAAQGHRLVVYARSVGERA